MHAKITAKRRIISVCVLTAFLVFFAFDLVKIQLIDGPEYDAASSSVSENYAAIEASRGEIVDVNGKPLVYNNQSYSIIFDSAYFPTKNDERNAIIESLISLFEKYSLQWLDEIPLVFDESGAIAFRPESEDLVEEMKSREMLHLNDYATPEDCFNALIDEFDLQSYAPETARKIGSVRYGMLKSYFRIGNPYTFATTYVAMKKYYRQKRNRACHGKISSRHRRRGNRFHRRQRQPYNRSHNRARARQHRCADNRCGTPEGCGGFA